MSNVGIFVDGANMFFSQKNTGWIIDYRKLYDYCGESGNIKVANYYSAYPFYLDTAGIRRYRNFRKALSNIGYTVKDKETKVRKVNYWEITIDGIPLDEFMRINQNNIVEHDGKICIKRSYKRDYKGNLDMEMGLGIYTEMNLYDICFLISGDGDFIPTARYLRQNGKHVICIGHRGSTGDDLINEVHCFQGLNTIKDKIERQ